MAGRTTADGSVVARAVKEIVDKKVYNFDGEEVGQIQELVIDLNDGRVTYAIMSFGGFLGIGDKLFAVPWVSLRHDMAQDHFVMKANKDLLKNAPGFDRGNWPDLSDPTRRNQIYKYYGGEPYWT